MTTLLRQGASVEPDGLGAFDALLTSPRPPRHVQRRNARTLPLPFAIMLGLLVGGAVAWLVLHVVLAELGVPAAPQPIDRMPTAPTAVLNA